jgi:hypothetical protein
MFLVADFDGPAAMLEAPQWMALEERTWYHRWPGRTCSTRAERLIEIAVLTVDQGDAGRW